MFGQIIFTQVTLIGTPSIDHRDFSIGLISLNPSNHSFYLYSPLFTSFHSFLIDSIHLIVFGQIIFTQVTLIGTPSIDHRDFSIGLISLNPSNHSFYLYSPLFTSFHSFLIDSIHFDRDFLIGFIPVTLIGTLSTDHREIPIGLFQVISIKSLISPHFTLFTSFHSFLIDSIHFDRDILIGFIQVTLIGTPSIDHREIPIGLFQVNSIHSLISPLFTSFHLFLIDSIHFDRDIHFHSHQVILIGTLSIDHRDFPIGLF